MAMDQDPQFETPETHIDKSVSVDGKFLGRDVGEFSLNQFSKQGLQEATVLGSDRLSTVIFETATGNIYSIYQDARSSDYVIIDARSNQGKGKAARGTLLHDQDLQGKSIRLGEPFAYGGMAHTSPIIKIIGISDRVYTPEYLAETTEGESSDLRERFRQQLQPKERQG